MTPREAIDRLSSMVTEAEGCPIDGDICHCESSEDCPVSLLVDPEMREQWTQE